MKPTSRLFRFALSGGAVATALSLTYVLLDLRPAWAGYVFYPGILAGWWWYENVSSNVGFCEGVGVATMSVVGALVGAALHGIRRLWRR